MIVSTGTVHEEHCTWQIVGYFSTYSRAGDYEHRNSARGTVHMKNSWLFLYLFMCTWTVHVEQWHAKKLSTSLLIHVHGIMSTGTVHAEQCTWKIVGYFYTYSCARIWARDQCRWDSTHDIDAYRWLDGGGAKTHTAGLDWVGIQFKL
jgi:hypothetical protein